MLRQAENKVRIEGILSEINLKYGSYVNKQTGALVDTIGGDIKVLVHQEVNGENIDLIIPVYMFSPKSFLRVYRKGYEGVLFHRSNW